MTRPPIDLPLFAWSRELHENRAKRRKIIRRAAWLAPLAAALILTIAFPPRPFFVWNASESAAIGLYWVDVRDDLRPGDMVIAWVPERYRIFAAKRHYLPVNVPVVKRIAAVSGDQICGFGHAVFVNYERVGTRQSSDRSGRKLPWWSGCTTLHDGSLFLLMDHPNSFDGRYFGPTSRADTVGKARLIWGR